MKHQRNAHTRNHDSQPATNGDSAPPVPTPPAGTFEAARDGGAACAGHDAISRRAYDIYVASGRRDGFCEDNWHRAEREIAKEKATKQASRDMQNEGGPPNPLADAGKSPDPKKLAVVH